MGLHKSLHGYMVYAARVQCYISLAKGSTKILEKAVQIKECKDLMLILRPWYNSSESGVFVGLTDCDVCQPGSLGIYDLTLCPDAMGS